MSENKTEYIPELRVILLGTSRAGITSILNNYCFNKPAVPFQTFGVKNYFYRADIPEGGQNGQAK